MDAREPPLPKPPKIERILQQHRRHLFLWEE